MKIKLPWEAGRQRARYRKLKLWSKGFSDCYVLQFDKGVSIPAHKDPVEGKKHYRLNISFKGHCEMKCEKMILNTKHVVLFRPDINEHSVEEFPEDVWMLSIGIAI